MPGPANRSSNDRGSKLAYLDPVINQIEGKGIFLLDRTHFMHHGGTAAALLHTKVAGRAVQR